MLKYSVYVWRLKRAMLVGALLLVGAGCTNANLGDLNETDDPRETMPGPGVLADEQGESPLTLKTGADKEAAKPVPVAAPVTGEKAEFEQFKKWNHLRTNDPQSAEYQEFLEWLRFQQFKAGQ